MRSEFRVMPESHPNTLNRNNHPLCAFVQPVGEVREPPLPRIHHSTPSSNNRPLSRSAGEG